jgi:hypothetical protein
MKKTLSLLLLVSLGAGTAMASSNSTEWLAQQSQNLKNDDNSVCLSGLETAVSGLSFIGYQKEVLANIGKYKAGTALAINNLRTGKMNGDVYNAFSNSLKFWGDKFYGRPIVDCVKPYVNFQDLYRSEVVAYNHFLKFKDKASYDAALKSRQAQMKMATQAMAKIKSLENAAK